MNNIFKFWKIMNKKKKKMKKKMKIKKSNKKFL